MFYFRPYSNYLWSYRLGLKHVILFAIYLKCYITLFKNNYVVLHLYFTLYYNHIIVFVYMVLALIYLSDIILVVYGDFVYSSGGNGP